MSSLLSAVGLKISSGRRTAALSLGQRQRVAIARALATSPKIILADEPTGNLDSKNSLKVMEILKALSKSRLVLCVTHNMNLVRLFADQAFVIEQGKFKPLESLEGTIDDAYKKGNAVSINALKETDFSTDDLLLKCYSDEEGEKKEIRIVKRGNEILVIGENLTLASPKDVRLVDKKEEEKQKEDIPSFEIDEKSISFPSRDEKPSWKDNAFLQEVLACAFPSRHEKKRLWKSFLNFVEVISPIVIFLLINFGVLALNEANARTGYDSSFENQFTFLSKKKSNESDSDFINSRVISPNKAMQLLVDDSGVVSLPFSSRLSLPIDYFDLSLSSYVVDTNIDLSSDQRGNVLIFSQDEISSIPYYSYLKDYKLQDNEVLLSSNFIDSNLASYPCYNGKTLQESTIGKPLKVTTLPYIESFSSPASVKYVLKDYFNFKETQFGGTYYTKYYAVIGGEKAAAELKNLALNYKVYSYRGVSFTAGMNLPDFSSYTFKNYEDIENDPDYELVSSGVSENTEQEELAKAYDLPTLYCSKAAFNDIKETSHSNFFVYKIVTDFVVNRQNEDEKALYFVKTKNVKNPLERFFSALVYNRFTHNRITSLPEGTTVSKEPSYEYKNGIVYSDIVLPSGLLEKFPSFDLEKDSLIMPMDSTYYMNGGTSFGDGGSLKENLSAVSTYEGDFSAPIYVARETETQLAYSLASSSIESKFYQGTSGNDYEYVYSYGPRFFTSDFAKTKAYFDEHVDEFGLEAITISHLFRLTIEQRNISAYRYIGIPVLVIGLSLVAFTILDSVATINQDKNKIGIYRCLGKSRGELLKNDVLKNLGRGLFTCVIPCTLLTAFLSIFYLYCLSIWIIPFFLAYYLLILLASETPMIATLALDPINIMHSLQ